MFREELDGWVKNMSRYSNGSDLPFWLTTWSGKAVSMNRKSGNSYLPRPFVPILGGVQPAILESFSTEENKSNGFLDRILLCCPEIKIEMYNSNEMNYTAIEYYDNWVRSFYRSIKMDILKNEDEEIIPTVFKMDVDAKYEWEKIYNEISIMQNSDEENEYMKSMLPKQKSYIPRFALLIHLINNFEINHIPVLISKETILKAFELSKYFIKQAQKVKVSAKETKTIASIVSGNKELSPKEIFEIMLKKGEKINYTKVAEMLNVTRATLYSWSKSV
jgi:DNA-binding transcriptional regulator YiaG